MNAIAEAYVKLVLAVGEHDADYVDAFYGPSSWRESVRAEKAGLSVVDRRARELLARVAAVDVVGRDEPTVLRRAYLEAQLRSLLARVAMLGGQKTSFDEESRALYDAVAPTHPDAYFQGILEELEPLLPGEGSLAARYGAFRERFVIPVERLDAVFRAAIEECRTRTLAHLDLPAGESFVIEYVTGKPWGAYNWYKGAYHSVIQVSTDLPVYIDRAVDLACHEGYPGHHVYNALLEKHLVRDRGWIEFSVYALFSPQSLIAEGTANYGIRVAFTPIERLTFERERLFPLAGLDPAQAERYYRVQETVERLGYAGNEAARRYVDGVIDASQAQALLERFALMTPARAEQRTRFVDRYRSYVINYNLGQDLVREYVEARSPTPERRWEVFGELLASPRLPSGLR